MRSVHKMMEISVYDEIHICLNNIKNMYIEYGGEISVLPFICERFAEILERLGTDHLRISIDIRGYFLKCLDQMAEIIYNDETHDFAQKWCKDNLDELHDLLFKLF